MAQPPMRRERIAFELRGDVADPTFFKTQKKGDPAAQLHCRSQELSDEPSGTRVACVDVGITDKSVLRRMGSNVVIHLLQHVIIGTCIQQVFSMIFTLPLKITLSP